MPPAKELANLLQLYALESGQNLRGLRILDAGVGSGNRLIELVRAFPDNTYTAIDFSEKSLAQARQKFADASIRNVSFEQANLEEPLTHLGEFDIVLCMGVLHHLQHPEKALKNLSALCEPKSLLFFYVYGELGSHERMRRKQILELLSAGETGLDWFEWVKSCDFVDLPYGWANLGDGLPLYLDAYKNPRERLYTCQLIFELVDQDLESLKHLQIYSWISEGKGYLVDIDAKKSKLPIKTTAISKLSSSETVSDKFMSLEKRQRLRLLDYAYQPEAYTVLLCGELASNNFEQSSRLRRNIIDLISAPPK